MIEDAIWNVVNVKSFGISEDHPIVQAYIELCREDPVFSAETTFHYLNVIINQFIVEKNGMLLVILYEHEHDEGINIDVWDTKNLDWVFNTVSKNRIKEELKSLYGQFV